MHIAVIIPFRQRGDRGLLEWTLEGYAGQRLGAGQTMEVRIGIDGGEEETIAPANGSGNAFSHTVLRLPRMGAAGVRNELVREAKAELLIFGNADARPEPDMVRLHADAMARLPAGSMVLGAAPWEKPARSTVFDALLAETPMVFFYGGLKGGESYDFRHCWTLNLSVRAVDFRKCGGFHELLRPVYYEDLAFGYRLLGPERKGIFYEPAAVVTHRHPTMLEQYLDREELLGLMAPVLARVCPEAFAAIHATADVAALAKQFRAWVAMDGASHKWVYRRFREWAFLPEDALAAGGAAQRERMLMTIYQMHIPLKRLAFRLGYLRGMELVDDARWLERQPQGLWRKIVQE